MHKIKPLGNRVIVKREEAKTTKRGILLPESAQQKSNADRQGASENQKSGVKPTRSKIDSSGYFGIGDEVLFSAYSGTEFNSGAEEVLILSEQDVLAVIQEGR